MTENTEASRKLHRGTNPRKWQHVLQIADGRLHIFGLEFGGWGAVAALIASALSLAFTAYDRIFIAPEPAVWPPETIDLVCDQRTLNGQLQPCGSTENVFLRATPITLINQASGDHPFTVRSMDASVSFIKSLNQVVRKICLDWQYISSITTSGGEKRPPGPFEVRSAAPFVQEIEFYPRRKPKSDGTVSGINFMHFRDMEKLIVDTPISKIVFNFEVEVVGQSERLTAACEVPVDGDFVGHASTGNFSLYPRQCVLSKATDGSCVE
jgi:hypothetical protein